MAAPAIPALAGALHITLAVACAPPPAPRAVTLALLLFLNAVLRLLNAIFPSADFLNTPRIVLFSIMDFAAPAMATTASATTVTAIPAGADMVTATRGLIAASTILTGGGDSGSSYDDDYNNNLGIADDGAEPAKSRRAADAPAGRGRSRSGRLRSILCGERDPPASARAGKSDPLPPTVLVYRDQHRQEGPELRNCGPDSVELHCSPHGKGPAR